MTIDEIKKSLELLKAEIEWDKSLEYQIVIDDAVKMLEELKELRKCVKSSAFQDGYNKAIDDFANGIKEIFEDNAIYNIDCIVTLAEQLKGEKNGREALEQRRD